MECCEWLVLGLFAGIILGGGLGVFFFNRAIRKTMSKIIEGERSICHLKAVGVKAYDTWDEVKPLEDWIDDANLREFVDEHLKIHMTIFGIEGEDQEGLIRLIMISLRQELRKGKEA